MTLECALQDLPLGDDKEGLCIDVNKYNNIELELISKKFIKLYS